MTKYVAVNALSLPHPHNKKRSILHTAGSVVELEGEVAERAVEMGAVRELDEGESEALEQSPATRAEVEAEVGDPAPVVLPERPSNGANKETWFSYLHDLEAATEELGPIHVGSDAKRDDLIAIGDARLRAWNEE